MHVFQVDVEDDSIFIQARNRHEYRLMKAPDEELTMSVIGMITEAKLPPIIDEIR